MSKNFIVYTITNLIDNKIYVGRTISVPKYRWSDHIRNAFVYQSKTHLHRAMRLYGVEHFSFDIFSIVASLEEMNNLEKMLIILFESYKPDVGYNMNYGDGATVETSVETRRKLSSSLTGHAVTQETRAKISRTQRGRKGRVWTEEERKAVTARQIGRQIHTEQSKKLIGMKNSIKLKGRTLSEETKKKMSEGQRRRSLLGRVGYDKNRSVLR